jgi:hypothetical protein
MSTEHFNYDSPLERACDEIREEPVDPAVIEEAAGRVWTRLTGMDQPRLVEKIRSCADFQALLPDYRAGRLSEPRRLLVEDHTHQCVACRKALEGVAKVVEFPALQPRRRVFSQRWAVAAAVVLGVGITSWGLIYYMNSPGGSRITVAAVNGVLYRMAEQGTQAVKTGDELPAGAEIRTAKDSNAVIRLHDGSLVEMRERSGFSVSQTRKDLMLNLGLGSIIVQAAKRSSGHLFVATRDCKVAVTGTVFSVTSGVKGSRVAVIEGEVHVTRDKDEKVLRGGEQFASSPAISPVAVQDEIAWSRNFDQHLAVLKEVKELQKRLDQVRFPDLRYSSKLMDLMPASTAIYASIPNLGSTLAEAQQVIQQRVLESPVLQSWWSQTQSHSGVKFDQIINQIRAFSEYLGDEIVMVVPASAAGALDAPVFVAELKRSGFREFLESEVRKLAPEVRGLHIISDASEAGGNAGWVLVRPDLVAISPHGMSLREVAATLDGRDSFRSTPFGAQVGEAYRNGAGILFSVDLERVAATKTSGHAPRGLADIRTLLVEQKESAGRSETRATVSFRGPRQGVFSWLAAPAPMRSLDFLSPETSLVAAFAMKNPGTMLDDTLEGQNVLEAESKLGFNVRDLAGPLGGEFAVALDGPVLPPAWKLVMEVYDAPKLQSTILKLVDLHNRECLPAGKPAVTLTQETASGRTYYGLKIPEMPFGEAQYTYVDGYLLAAANRQLVDRALQYRASGYTLARSTQFRSLVPRDHYSNFSAVVYQNAGSSVAPFIGLLGGTSLLSPEQQKSLAEVSAQLKPTLITAYGEEDRITVAGNGSMFGLSLDNLIRGNLLGMGGGIPLPGIMPGTPRRLPAYRKEW